MFGHFKIMYFHLVALIMNMKIIIFKKVGVTAMVGGLEYK